MKTWCAHVARIASVLVLTSSLAHAQQLAGTFDQLRVLVKTGDTLTITDASGHRVRGKLVDLSMSSLVLEASGARRRFQDIEVGTIEKRGSDSLKNGALIGLSIGAGVFGSAIAAATGDAGFAALGALVYGGIGAGIGVGFDALVEGPRVIYAATPSGSRAFQIAPILSRSRKGVTLSFRAW
jgi:hypothetical protein